MLDHSLITRRKHIKMIKSSKFGNWKKSRLLMKDNLLHEKLDSFCPLLWRLAEFPRKAPYLAKLTLL